MNKTLKKALIGFILPAAAIYIISTINLWFGFLAIIAYLAILLYISRVTVFSLIGSRKYSMGNMDEALKWFSKAHNCRKAGVKTSISYGYLLLKSGDLKNSEEILQKLLKDNQKSPDLPKIKSNLALVLWKKGEIDAAAAMLEEVIETYKTTTVYGSLGYLLILKGDLERALQFNQEAYEYNSSDKIIQDNLGQNYYLLGMYDKSREIYEALLAKAPSFPEPYYNYGLLLDKLGEQDAAIENMNKALSFKFTFLSSITREEVEAKLQEIGRHKE